MGLDEFARFRLAADCAEMNVKKKHITATVQISNSEPVDVLLSQNCSTLSEHASFLQEKINQSKGNLIGLDLPGSVQLYAIFMDKTAVLDHEIQLDVDLKYTFRFKLVAEVVEGQQEDGPNQIEDLAIKIAQMVEEKDELKKLVEEQVGKVEELQKLRVEEQKIRRMPEFLYAYLIGVPNVTNLEEGHYSREKLLKLIQHGNAITSRLYIQRNQKLHDDELVESIVDLLFTTEKPANVIEETSIEADKFWFKWPQNRELTYKRKLPNVAIPLDQASESAETTKSNCTLVEYELVNKGCHFHVDIYYWNEDLFNKWIKKFVCRRLV